MDSAFDDGITTTADSGDTDTWDVGGTGGGGCEEGNGNNGNPSDEPEFVMLWVANSPEDTVSKIDTLAGQEIARYKSGPAGADPSRTSVNLAGDMVVVNRGGSVTKIYTNAEACPDGGNGQGGLQTSTGPTDVLPWGGDDCIAWHKELPLTEAGTPGQYAAGPRPVAWEGGDPDTCYANPRVWVGWYDKPVNQGVFQRLDGQSGETLDEVAVPWNGLQWGPYGGAVNKDGDYWVIGWRDGPLVRIDEDGTNYETYPVPQPPSGQLWTYGMALDEHGRPWIASAGNVLHFDPGSKQFSWIDTGNTSLRGVGADREGRVWFAVDSTASGGCGLAVVDYTSNSLLAPAVQLSGCVQPVGVSVDTDGFVWVVDQGASRAFQVNPDTYQVMNTVSGLNSPYTYSDMTGSGLGLVTNPPVG
jgi:streptogramin lyase